MGGKILAAVAALLLTGCQETAVSTNPVDAVELQHGRAGLQPLIQQKVAAHKTPILYFYADWCGPCRRYRASLVEPELEAALTRATLIKINIDTDSTLASDYGIQAVPTFIKVDSLGNSLAQITSDEWENDVPEEIAAVMTRLVEKAEYDTKKP